MTPGTYLRLRREAAGLEIEDVALEAETIPALSARDRAAWIASIEKDIAPISAGTATVLRAIYRFDAQVLLALMAERDGFVVAVPRLCAGCACSEWDACEDGCAWSVRAPEFCSACADPQPREIIQLAVQPENHP